MGTCLLLLSLFIVDTTMAGRVEVTLSRPAPGSWGLRLQGGVDVQKALAIINVADGSPSEMSGLKIGDVLLQINGQDCSMMTHKAAQDAIVGSGDRVELLVQRWSAPAPAPQGVWKPGVQLVGSPATGPAPQGQTYTQTSLVANPMVEDSHWDVKHNVTAKAFTAGESAPGFRSVAAPVTKPVALHQEDLPNCRCAGSAPSLSWGFSSRLKVGLPMQNALSALSARLP